MLILRALLCAFGAILLALSFTVYEDEERNIQSRLENYWIALEDRRIASYPVEKRFHQRFSARLALLLDSYLGQKLISLPSIIVTTAGSIATFALILLVYVMSTMGSTAPLTTQDKIGLGGLTFIVTWSLLCVVFARRWPKATLIWWLLPFAVLTFYITTARSRHASDFIIMLGSVFGSFLADMLVLAATRLFLRHSVATNSLLQLIAAWTGAIALLLCFCVLPGVFTLSRYLDLRLHPDRNVYFQTVRLLSMFNISDLLFLASVIFVLNTTT